MKYKDIKPGKKYIWDLRPRLGKDFNPFPITITAKRDGNIYCNGNKIPNWEYLREVEEFNKEKIDKMTL